MRFWEGHNSDDLPAALKNSEPFGVGEQNLLGLVHCLGALARLQVNRGVIFLSGVDKSDQRLIATRGNEVIRTVHESLSRQVNEEDFRPTPVQLFRQRLTRGRNLRVARHVRIEDDAGLATPPPNAIHVEQRAPSLLALSIRARLDSRLSVPSPAPAGGDDEPLPSAALGQGGERER